MGFSAVYAVRIYEKTLSPSLLSEEYYVYHDCFATALDFMLWHFYYKCKNTYFHRLRCHFLLFAKE